MILYRSMNFDFVLSVLCAHKMDILIATSILTLILWGVWKLDQLVKWSDSLHTTCPKCKGRDTLFFGYSTLAGTPEGMKHQTFVCSKCSHRGEEFISAS